MDIQAIIEKIASFFSKPEAETAGIAPDGICDLCWGYQNYDGKIRELYRDKQIDVNNKKDSYMLIQKFVKDHVDGYQLKEGEIHVCPDCPKLKDE